jgi:acyl-CoA thioester hydrolase
MPRTKIEERPSYPFSAELDVRVSDLNYGAHLGYDRILGLAHQARLLLLRELGVTEMDLGDGRAGLMAADVAVAYEGEAFVHDVLVFELRPVEVGRGSFRLAHRVRKRDGARVALVEIGFAAFDYQARKAVALPAGFRSALVALDRG